MPEDRLLLMAGVAGHQERILLQAHIRGQLGAGRPRELDGGRECLAREFRSVDGEQDMFEHGMAFRMSDLADWKLASGSRSLAQDDVQLVLQMQFLLLEDFDGSAIGGDQGRLHVLDLLVQFVVAGKQPRKAGVLGFEEGYLIAEFGEHGPHLGWELEGWEFRDIVPRSKRSRFDMDHAARQMTGDIGGM